MKLPVQAENVSSLCNVSPLCCAVRSGGSLAAAAH